MLLPAGYRRAATQTPDLKLFLSPKPLEEIGDRNATDGSLLIAPLQRHRGAQRYELDEAVDLALLRNRADEEQLPMSETIAGWLVMALGVYAGLGLLFGVAFVTRGVARIDPQAVGGSWGFRLVILPGVVALWPILARRWAGGQPPPEERNAHRDRAHRDRASGGGNR